MLLLLFGSHIRWNIFFYRHNKGIRASIRDSYTEVKKTQNEGKGVEWSYTGDCGFPYPINDSVEHQLWQQRSYILPIICQCYQQHRGWFTIITTSWRLYTSNTLIQNLYLFKLNACVTVCLLIPINGYANRDPISYQLSSNVTNNIVNDVPTSLHHEGFTQVIHNLYLFKLNVYFTVCLCYFTCIYSFTNSLHIEGFTQVCFNK